MRKVCLVALLLLLCCSIIGAEDYSVEYVPDLESLTKSVQPLPPALSKEGELLTLTECLQIARENHPTLQSSWAQVLQSKASLDQIWALYYPTASLTLAEDVKETFLSELDNRNLPSQLGISRSATASLSVTQTLFDSGARSAQVEAARKALLSQYFSFETAWVTQANSVQSAYLNLVKQEYLLVVNLLDLERVTANRTAAQRFLAAGTKSLVDVSQAEIQVAQAEGNLAAQRNAVRVARISLAQTMNVEVDTLLDRQFEDLLSIDTDLPPFDESLKELESHPKLMALRAQEKSVLSSAEAEKRSLRPSLGLSTSLQAYRKSPIQTGLWDVQLTLSIPLFNPSIGPQVDEYEAQALQAQKQAEATKLELEQNLKTAYSDRQGATERVEAARRQAQTAIVNFDLASKRYKAGLTDYTELLNALSFVSAAQSTYVTALADERRAEIDLLQSTGAAAQFSKTYFSRQFEAEIGEDLDLFTE